MTSHQIFFEGFANCHLKQCPCRKRKNAGEPSQWKSYALFLVPLWKVILIGRRVGHAHCCCFDHFDRAPGHPLIEMLAPCEPLSDTCSVRTNFERTRLLSSNSQGCDESSESLPTRRISVEDLQHEKDVIKGVKTRLRICGTTSSSKTSSNMRRPWLAAASLKTFNSLKTENGLR